MPHANESSFIARLADLFRAEGDTTTADALVARNESRAARTISDEDHERVLELQRKGRKLDSQGAHERAEVRFEAALRLVEDALGPEHAGIIDHLNDLARSRLSGGDFHAAFEDYSRLLQLIESTHGADDTRVAIVRFFVERCRKGMRDATGIWRLQAQVDLMLQHARGVQLRETSNTADRTLAIAHRLVARGRHAWAVRLYERWITLQLQHASPDDDLALLDIRDYALALRGAGELARAASVLRQVVVMRNRRSEWDSDETELLRAMQDLQSCLEALGAVRSAAETARLADSIASKRGRGG